MSNGAERCAATQAMLTGLSIKPSLGGIRSIRFFRARRAIRRRIERPAPGSGLRTQRKLEALKMMRDVDRAGRIQERKREIDAVRTAQRSRGCAGACVQGAVLVKHFREVSPCRNW